MRNQEKAKLIAQYQKALRAGKDDRAAYLLDQINKLDAKA
ncbi:hypothetical protein [Synechococcus phage S-N03]|uniref:Uncharacterized protein n=1 Tax=Synechococcus phage S-N03 TaxID=2718943 RepID=A0A6G8R5U4_9CAUD|nr:hypothetical protein PQC09_gp108 [Synechococcus phage S-N03]QIN96743.1 hypothetical protein [Synechococcus phage S-N03]